MRNTIGFATLVAALLLATSARASRRFPQTVATDLGLSYEPPCSLCHLKANVGPGTAGTPFALSMRARGLVSGNVAEVSSALAGLKQDRVDDDGDGVPDVDELLAGTDPNTPGGTGLMHESDPSYGCGGGGGTRQGQAALPLVFMTSVAALIRRRRRSLIARRPRRFVQYVAAVRSDGPSVYLRRLIDSPYEAQLPRLKNRSPGRRFLRR